MTTTVPETTDAVPVDGETATRKPSNQHTHAKCGATWTGSRPCHCSGCCRTFSGLTLFDRHRDQRGEYGRCLDPAEFGDVEQRADGVWAYPEMTADSKAKIYGRGA